MSPLEYQVQLDMLMMRSVGSGELFRRQDVMMAKWKQALDDMRNEDSLITLWYLLTLRYKKTTWYHVDQARKAYDAVEIEFNKTPSSIGLYWDEQGTNT
jgi:hypothetical protein